MVRGPRVLDLGCCKNVFPRTKEEFPGWLHALLVEAGHSVLGADINQEHISSMAEAGYEVVYMNAQAIPPEGEKFDTIVAGELIEHLENPGLFLTSCRRRLTPEGRLVLTTPNPFGVMDILGYIKNFDHAFNVEHTCWFDAQTIRQLLERCGFRVIELCFVDDLHPETIKRKSSRFDYYLYRLFSSVWMAGRWLLPSRFRNTIVVHAAIDERIGEL
jgi:SAM-dependent methyltransferase